MEIRFLKKIICISILFLAGLLPLAAQTVLVHSPALGDEPEQEIKLAMQSAEAGVIDALFNRGIIVFSDMSDTDRSGLQRIAGKIDCEYIVDWKLSTSGLTGRLISSVDMSVLQESRISEADYENRYKNQEELYTILGTRLCEMLIGDRW